MGQSFLNKTAVITGGAFGIGRAACLSFAREGAKVVIADTDKENGTGLKNQIIQNGGQAHFVKMDVSSAKEVQNMAEETLKTFGSLDFAFNNAGIGSNFVGLTADYPEETWLQIINVNLTGVWLCMKFELQAMLKQKAGVIINNASALGLVGFKTASPYCASKHGVIGLTQTAAIEYAAKGIRINAICPGFIETPMLKKTVGKNDAALKSIIERHPIKRLGKPEEIAEAVIYLCRDESAFINGSSFVIDGGYLAV